MTEDEKELRRKELARRRKQVTREFFQLVADCTWESAWEVVRMFGYIFLFIMVIWMLTPTQ